MSSSATYATPGPMTGLPPDLSQLEGLPADPRTLRDLIPGLIVHGDLRWLYDLDTAPAMAEMNLRPATAIVERIMERNPAPLTGTRPPEQRMIGVCRHFTTLYVALLRAQGVPARARAGFAGYFGDEEDWVDHWIAERWDGRRWIRVDPQLDARQTERFGITVDPQDLPPGAFLTGAEAWAGMRAGDLDARHFGIMDVRGVFFIAGNVARDLAALNKMEVLPWDVWGAVLPWDTDSAVEVEVVDRLAAAVASGDEEQIRQAYEQTPGLRVTAESDLIPVRTQ